MAKIAETMAETPPKPSGTAHQLVLDLDLPPHFGREDFLAAPANMMALRMVEAWPQWPDPLLLLLGPAGAGKSHLAAIWAARAGADVIFGDRLGAADVLALAEKPALVIEQADAIGAAEASLFHLVNLARERKTSIVLTSRQRPEFWQLATADLLSRLRLASAVELEPPDEALLKAVLVKLFCDRQLVVEASLVDYIARHSDRSLDMARRLVALIDREALARGRKVTRAMARELLQALHKDEDEA